MMQKDKDQWVVLKITSNGVQKFQVKLVDVETWRMCTCVV